MALASKMKEHLDKRAYKGNSSLTFPKPAFGQLLIASLINQLQRVARESEPTRSSSLFRLDLATFLKDHADTFAASIMTRPEDADLTKIIRNAVMYNQCSSTPTDGVSCSNLEWRSLKCTKCNHIRTKTGRDRLADLRSTIKLQLNHAGLSNMIPTLTSERDGVTASVLALRLCFAYALHSRQRFASAFSYDQNNATSNAVRDRVLRIHKQSKLPSIGHPDQQHLALVNDFLSHPGTKPAASNRPYNDPPKLIYINAAMKRVLAVW